MKKITIVFLLLLGLAGCALFFPAGVWQDMSPVQAPTTYLRFQIELGNLFLAGHGLTNNTVGNPSGVELFLLIDDEDKSYETKNSSNGIALWGLPEILFPEEFTPDYYLAIKPKVPKTNYYHISILDDGIGVWNTISGDGISNGNQYNLPNIFPNSYFSWASDNNDNVVMGTNGAIYTFTNNILYLNIPYHVLGLSNLSFIVLTWGSGTNWTVINNVYNGLVWSYPANPQGHVVNTVSTQYQFNQIPPFVYVNP